jgi:hypothetical protein
MPRSVRLGSFENNLDITPAEFPIKEQVDNPQAVHVGQRLKVSFQISHDTSYGAMRIDAYILSNGSPNVNPSELRWSAARKAFIRRE